MLLEEFPFEPGFRLTDGDLLNKVAAEPAYSVDNTVTATGTTQNTAYNLRATVTSITAGGDQTGVRLPFPKVGRILYIMNYTATAKKIYAYDTELINNAASADLPFAFAAIMVCTGNNSWMAAIVGSDTLTGDIILDAADADTPTGDGHLVQIEGGTGGTTSGNGGGVTIQSGQAVGNPGDAGDIVIQGANSTNGRGGDVFIGAGTGATNGEVIFNVVPTTAPIIIKALGGPAPIAPFPGFTMLEIIGPDAGNVGITIDSHGNGPSGGTAAINFRAYNSAGIVAGRNMAMLRVYGWTGAAYAAAESAHIYFQAGEDFTPTANGTAIIFATTPLGSITNAEALRIAPSGNLLVGTTTDAGSRMQISGSNYAQLRVANSAVMQSPAGLDLTNDLVQVQNTDGNGTFFVATAINAGGAGFRSYNAPGTSAAPTAVTGITLMGALQGGSFDGTSWAIQASENFQAVGPWSPASHPAQIIWQTTPTGSTTITQGMVLFPSGNLQIASAGPVDNGSKLQVGGNAAISNNLLVGTTVDDGSNRLQVTNTNPVGPWLAIFNANATEPPTRPTGANVWLVGQDGGSSTLALDSYGLGTSGILISRKANGSLAAPTPVASGNAMFQLRIEGMLPSGNYTGASAYSVTADAAWSNTSSPVRQAWFTCPVGSTVTSERMRLSSNGNLLVGLTTDSNYKLDVAGNGRFSTGLGVWGSNPPATQPTVTGSRGGNAAVASLLTALAATGLIIDGSVP